MNRSIVLILLGLAIFGLRIKCNNISGFGSLNGNCVLFFFGKEMFSFKRSFLEPKDGIRIMTNPPIIGDEYNPLIQ